MIALVASLALAAETPTPAADPADLAAALQAEMARAQAKLTLPNAPPIYHLRYHLVLMDQIDVEASFGSLVRSSTDPFHALSVEVRVGTPEYDNTGFGGWQNGFNTTGLPRDVNPYVLRLDAWRVTDGAYKDAVEQYARKTSAFEAPPDWPGNYTLTGPVKADQAPLTLGPATGLKQRAVALSGVFAGTPLLLGGVWVGAEAGTFWTIDTEGTSVRRAASECTVRAAAHVRADDGMLITDQRLWTARSEAALPPADEMLAATTALRDELLAVAQAPALDEEYVGPVVFEDTAATDLFRYVLVPQIEGTPPEIPFDSFFGEMGDTDSPVRLGRRVLPEGWSATDNPGGNPDDPSSFTWDSEGTPAEPVEVVTEGIVRNLLMSRIPRKGVDGTNGHARGYGGQPAKGRVSQLSVVPATHLTHARLMKAAFQEAKDYGRDWVLVVRRLQEPAILGLGGGDAFLFSMLSDEDQQATLLPPPVAVYRVYADGREEQLRGARFASVQRWILRDILAAGPLVSAHWMASTDGSMASLGPTEGMPTWISAPEVLIGEVELVPAPGDPKDKALVPPPR